MSKNSTHNASLIAPKVFKLNKAKSKEWLLYAQQSFQNMSKDSKWTVILIE